MENARIAVDATTSISAAFCETDNTVRLWITTPGAGGLQMHIDADKADTFGDQVAQAIDNALALELD